jgi:hypothetical protein
MKLLKRLIIGLLALVALFLVVAVFLPSHYHVERSIVVQAKPEAIFPYVNNLKKWQDWQAWTKAKDPTLVYSYEGPEEGAGAVSKWEAKKMGQGEMKITAAETGKSVSFDLSFDHGKYRSDGKFTFTPEGDGTRVVWSFEGNSGANPINRYFSLFMDRMIGPDFEEGLRNLKHKAEGK